jgi:hypothetical protein
MGDSLLAEAFATCANDCVIGTSTAPVRELEELPLF